MKYEYLVIKELTSMKLCELGKVGWELISVCRDSYGHPAAYMMREFVEPVKVEEPIKKPRGNPRLKKPDDKSALPS